MATLKTARSRAQAKPAAARAALRTLPQMSLLLERDEVRSVAARHGRDLVMALLRSRLEEIRRRLLGGSLPPARLAVELGDLASWLEREARERTTSTLRPVVNATGVILHTNLGRAVLSEEAVRRVAEVARAYTTLEYDLGSGRRGSRSSHLDRMLALLFPGRAFQVVNNNAAAVLLALNTLGEGKEVVVSRGELVEIGGSFRIPDIMRKSGAVLREVGTTNRTRLGDYERAIGAKTGLLLKVHPSNYRIVGFTAQAPLEEVATLGKRRGLPVLMDQGSGNLIDLEPHGIRGEPSAQEALEAGADVVCFSGDKMLGGPQAGLIVGRRDLIQPMKENSLTRALRVDKVTYAALETVLLEYARGTAGTTLPVLRMVMMTPGVIEQRSRLLMERVASRAGASLTLAIVSGQSLSGGGSAPEEGLPTSLVEVRVKSRSARRVEGALRSHATPIIARIETGRVLLDLRTVPEEQEAVLVEALVALDPRA